MAAAMARPLAAGELVEFDIRRLRRQAMPEYVGGEGGVSATTIEAMLNRMIEVLGFPGMSEADNDLQTSLQLFRALIQKQSMKINAMKHCLRTLELCIADGDAEDAAEEIETMRLCAQPVDKVMLYP